MWETTHMTTGARTELQDVLVEAIARSGQTRDHLDSLLKQKLNTKGKWLWDIERGKVKRPNPDVLRAIEEVLAFAPDHLVDLVYPQPMIARGEAGHSSRMPEQPTVQSADAAESVNIVQLDLSLAMGPGTIIEEFVEAEQVAFDLSVLRRITRTPSDRLRFVTGIGTSHEPKFQSNDQFLIDINERRLTRIDGYYWITFDGAHALKRLRPLGGGRVQVISENPEYAPMELDAGEVRIEGRAIWFARGL